MPPAPGSATAARTSSTDSGVSRNSASLTTFTEQRYPDRAGAADTEPTAGRGAPTATPVLTAAAAAADLADHPRRAHYRDRGPGRGDRRLLARAPARGP